MTAKKEKIPLRSLKERAEMMMGIGGTIMKYMAYAETRSSRTMCECNSTAGRGSGILCTPSGFPAPRHDGNHNNGTQFNSIAYRKEISVAAICASRLRAAVTWARTHCICLLMYSGAGGAGRGGVRHCSPVKWVTLTAAQMTIAGQQILGNCCSCWPGLNAYALTE